MFLNLDNPIVERPTKTVYKDGDKTIKLFVEKYSKANILNEALNQARVEEGTDLNVPKLIEISRIDNRWALVSEHVEGISMDKLMEQNPEKIDEYLNKFIDVQLNILSKTVPLLNRIKDKYKRKINDLTNINENIKYELLQRLDGMKNHTKLCHGDFNPSNVIVKEDGSIAVIDWAHVTIGNASADAAQTYLLFTLEGKEDIANKYVDLFAKKSGIDKSYVQRWIPIVAAIKKGKASQEEQIILDKWVDVVDYE